MNKTLIDYSKMTDEELKSEFIKYFGEDKWNEVEAIVLNSTLFKVSIVKLNEVRI